MSDIPFKPIASAVGDVPFIRSSRAIAAVLLVEEDTLKKQLEVWLISLDDK